MEAEEELDGHDKEVPILDHNDECAEHGWGESDADEGESRDPAKLYSDDISLRCQEAEESENTSLDVLRTAGAERHADSG